MWVWNAHSLCRESALMIKATGKGTPAAEVPTRVRGEAANGALKMRNPSGPVGVTSVLQTSNKENVVKGSIKKPIVKVPRHQPLITSLFQKNAVPDAPLAKPRTDAPLVQPSTVVNYTKVTKDSKSQTVLTKKQLQSKEANETDSKSQTVLTNKQLQGQEANRCMHVDPDTGELDCLKSGNYFRCNADGTPETKSSRAQKMCGDHQLPGQVYAPGLRKKLKIQRAGKGAQAKKKKPLKRKVSSRSNSSGSSSSASTSSSGTCNSNASYSTSDSNYSSRVAGNSLKVFFFLLMRTCNTTAFDSNF